MGTFLAGILAAALASALFVAGAVVARKDPVVKQKRRITEFVTREELEERLSEELEKFDWKREEWHEKFTTLHARLAKRTQRKAEPVEGDQLEIEEVPSIVHRRRLGSV